MLGLILAALLVLTAVPAGATTGSLTVTFTGGEAPTWRVGPDRVGAGTFTSPRALWSSGQLQTGDTVQIDACTYTDDYDATSSNGVNITKAVSITSVASSSPHCVVTDPWAGAYPGHPPMAVIQLSPMCADQAKSCYWGISKGLWNVEVGGVTIDHVAFLTAYNAPSDTNAAGLRLEHPSGTVTVTNSFFAHNQNGILASSTGNVAIDRSEFYDNGLGGCFDSCTHQVYLSGGSVTITNSYFHDLSLTTTPYNAPAGDLGNQIKSRANSTTIQNTRVFDNASGASYEIDIPQGGTISLTGNVIQQGVNTKQRIIMDTGVSGGDGAMHTSTGMTVSNNTFVNDYVAATPIGIHNGSTATVTGSGNSWWGVTAAQTKDATGAVNLSGNVFLGSRPALNTASPVQ